MLGLYCCMDFSLVGVSGGYSLVVVLGLLAVASLIVDHGLQGARASVVVARGLSSRSFWALECGLRN